MLLVNLLPFALLAWLPNIIPFALALALHAVPTITGQLSPALVLASPYVRVVYGIWLLILWCATFNTITRYYLNEWIITTTRIIEIHQYGFFSREVSSLLLVKIQDVNVDVEGLFSTLLGFGQLEVQSAGTQEHFIMDDIPSPGWLRDIIMREIATLHADGRPVAGQSVGSSL